MTDYSELVKALTCGNDGKLPCHNNECPYWVDKWHGIGLCNVIKKDADAAAAIEALQAQLPKRGKWIIHPEVKNIYGGVYIECPFCGEKYVVQNVSDEKFCRNCGADMRAKLEVRDDKA